MPTFTVLGPLTVQLGGEVVEVTGARQRAVLARLLVARGRVVPVGVLVDDLWGDDPPAQPAAAVQAFVSRLRRRLEPGRPSRSTASVVVTAHPGYAVRPDPDRVDAWRFERLVRGVAGRSDPDPSASLAALDEALALWRGAAYAEFADSGWARREAARLDDLRCDAVELRADAALRLARPTEVLAALGPHVAAHPLRERGWALLAAAQYAAGSQADALATLRRARSALADAAGLDPGPALRALEADILAQAPHLITVPPPRPVAEPDGDADWFVGRQGELDRLLSLAERGGVVHVLGEAGAGKTALLDRLVDLLAAQGWSVGRGRCAETGGVLPGWPWAEAVRALARTHPPSAHVAEDLGWLLRDDSATDPDPLRGQHRMRRALHDHLAGVAERGRLLLVLDDVHRADDETLAILVPLCAALAGRPVLVVLARRPSETSDALDAALAELARHEPERLVLPGLDPDGVAAILAATLPGPVAPDVVDALTVRTGGNPFFVREAARLLATAGPEAALSAVPVGVREVLGRRIAQLSSPARTVLAHAAVLGRDITLDVLADLGGEPEDVVLDRVEEALVVGLLDEPAPGRVAFPHALVRDAVYGTTSQLRRVRLHVRAAEAIARRRPDDVTAVAHHYATADDPALAGTLLRYARLAAVEAERRYAHREAARWWRVALTALDRCGGSAADRLELLVPLVRAVASAGDLVAARALRAETLALADTIDDPVLAASAIACFDVPTIWTSHPYGSVDLDVVRRTEDVLRRLPPGDSEPRCRMLIDLAIELEGEDDERGFAAAGEAEAMARRLGDPGLLTMALNAVLLEHYGPDGHGERRRVGAELLGVGRDAGIVSAQVLGHMALAQSHVAHGEVEPADEHVAAVESLARTHEQPLTLAIASWYHGLRRVVAGDLDAALAAYEEAARRTARVTMWQGVGDTTTVATGCAWLSVGRMGELATRWEADTATGRMYPELYALALAHAGRIAEARAAAGPPLPIRRDYALDLNWAVRGLLGIAIDDHDRVAGAYRELRPFPHLLAAAGTAVLAVAPVAEVLGDLAAHRGENALAVDHYARAVEVATRAGATHWAERAAGSARALGG